MNESIHKIKNYFKNSYEILVAVIIFAFVVFSNIEFYKTIILMLEFIVILEVIKMISDFIKKEKLRLRFVIDIFIIFLIRDVIILASHKTKDYLDITFLLIVIFVFFIFRILSIKFSPGVIKVSKDVVIEYEDERKDETLKK
ncbi:MAG: phosphate-starvation-inducible PsiE family protein [Campylobacterales bacterium]|nr:phosphate-starvation-inducible PsiE family protein [Campylobacterales bacterium]